LVDPSAVLVAPQKDLSIRRQDFDRHETGGAAGALAGLAGARRIRRQHREVKAAAARGEVSRQTGAEPGVAIRYRERIADRLEGFKGA
jgi:hypothetical protein